MHTIDYDHEIDRIGALIEIYEQAIASISGKLKTADRAKRLELTKLKAQHETGLSSLERQRQVLRDRRSAAYHAEPLRITDAERSAAIVRDALRRSVESECPYCGRMTNTIQGCKECLNIIAQENQNAQ